MNRFILVACLAILLSGGCRPCSDAHILGTEQIIATSPCPDSIFLYTPAIVVTPSGRYVVAVDYGGPGTAALDGPKSDLGDYRAGNQIRVLLSDDKGRTWRSSSVPVKRCI